MSVCPEGACDDFVLDIRVAPSRNAKRVRYVEVEIKATSQESDTADLVVFPPDADPSRDFTIHDSDTARLLDPEPGRWRIQARCVTTEPCRDVTYTGHATTGQVRVPHAVAHHAGGIKIASRKLRALAPRMQMHRVGSSAFEPTLGVSADGSVFYQGLTNDQVPRVLRSDDGGETWENVSPKIGPLYRHATSFDPFLHVDEDTSRVFTADLLLVDSELSFTDDQGATWTTTQVRGHMDHEHLFTGPPVFSPTVGYPNIVYYCAINAGALVSFSTMTTCAKSLDGGLTFVYTGSPPYLEDPGQGDGHFGIPGHCSGEVAHGVAGPDGSIYLPRGFCGQPYLAISHDEGLTWTRIQVADNGMPRSPAGIGDQLEHEASVAVDATGNLYYVWGAEDRLPYLAISRDGGETWSKPMMIGAPGVNEASFPSIDVGRPGSVAVMYMGTEESPGSPFTGEYEDVPWNGYMMMTTSALEDDPVFFTATVNDPADPLVVGTCGPHRCESAGDFFDVVIAPDGTPWAAFVDACAGERCTPYGGSPEDGIVGHLVGGPALK